MFWEDVDTSLSKISSSCKRPGIPAVFIVVVVVVEGRLSTDWEGRRFKKKIFF
ncbi:unnamed protein product [Meloidogyne enterolobii]|uniref:Uncharacterized protein n=1 Tax=Meloidogyne enterolobii TaxID=390850 RepID=A0ACB0ZWT4_MELEN